MRLKHILVSILAVGIQASAWAQDIATLEIDMPKETSFSAVPVGIGLDEITPLADSLLVLVEWVDGEAVPVNFQIDNEKGRMVWVLDQKRKGKRVFKVMRGQTSSSVPAITSKVEDGGIVLANADRPLLRYNYATMMPPEGVNEVFKRSGFIHPFWSPAGKELTRIQAPDHYHHYGLWNPWTRVEYKGKTIDFWNLGERQGTVRYANTITRISGPVYGAFRVLHEHVVFDKDTEEVAINEVQGVRIYQQEDEKGDYIMDISIDMNCATDEEVVLKEYRYGGLGWRATGKWHRDNSEIITSEGFNRKEADGSLARWCIVQGEIDEGYASVVMMSFPTNYNHPEPLRIWPEDIYDRGDMFANFSPTKNMDWKLEPGKNYQLNYRFYVSDQKISAEQAEALWQAYAHPPKIKVILN